MKYLLSILFVFALVHLIFAQQDEMKLLSSDRSTFIDQRGLASIIPVYSHKGNTLSADSGILYKDEIGREFFEAFGNIVIRQTSGTVINANRMHYDASTQLAQLFGNVRMVDGASTLTTNYLTYNMRSKIGTYTGGGRIISQGDTITSKNAYYFENTQDSYFRNNVIVRNAQVKVYTDTMRYNSASRMTYFFGPTNIKGNKGENLYTELGNYNTATGIANFSKENLYTEGTRFLKGDSLYYDRDKGIGEAYRNVIYVDTLDKFYAYGDKGLYKQDDESILLTEKPLIIIAIKNDSTENSTADSTQIAETDTVEKKSARQLKREQSKVEENTVRQADEEDLDSTVQTDSIAVIERPPHLQREAVKPVDIDSAYLTADTIFSKVILLKDYNALNLNLSRDGGQIEADTDEDYGDDDVNEPGLESIVDSLGNTLDLGLDSLEITARDSTSFDSVRNNIAIKKDTVQSVAEKKVEIKPKTEQKIPAPKTAGTRDHIESTLRADSLLRRDAVIPQEGHADSVMNQVLKVAQTADTLKRTETIDSLGTNSVSDTARTRIVRAHYNVRLFKSDLQAVADSAYYGMADSMFRFMGKPMIWAQGSQISGDTIYMQMVNQKLDNALLKGNAFMVNVVADTVKFNQLKGRKITAFFVNNDIDLLFVDGNAENLVFSNDEKTKVITEMFHDRGARIRVKMDKREIIDYVTIRKVDQKVYPFAMVSQENEILPGFIWRPQDRPTSKEDLLNRKRSLTENTEVSNGQKEGETGESPSVETESGKKVPDPSQKSIESISEFEKPER